MLKFRGKTVMFDCGIHPGHSGMSSLPYFDDINPSEVDLCLVIWRNPSNREPQRISKYRNSNILYLDISYVYRM